MMELKVVVCGESFFSQDQLERWDTSHLVTLTDSLMDAQLWQGDEDVQPEDVIKYCGGRVVTLREVQP